MNQNTIDISTMSIGDLKIMGFDLIHKIQNDNKLLNSIYLELDKKLRQQIETNPVSV